MSAVGQGNFVNHRDKAIDYVREYMRKLVPHASVVGEQNANSLQKAVVNAMTLDHDQTATEFVRNYILEKNNMRVGELRESIRTYRNINETIKTMREKLEALLALRATIQELAAAHEQGMREAVPRVRVAERPPERDPERLTVVPHAGPADALHEAYRDVNVSYGAGSGEGPGDQSRSEGAAGGRLRDL